MVQDLDSESDTDSDTGKPLPSQRIMPSTNEKAARDDVHLPDIRTQQQVKRKSVPTKPEVAERIRSAQQLIKTHPLKQPTC